MARRRRRHTTHRRKTHRAAPKKAKHLTVAKKKQVRTAIRSLKKLLK